MWPVGGEQLPEIVSQAGWRIGYLDQCALPVGCFVARQHTKENSLKVKLGDPLSVFGVMYRSWRTQASASPQSPPQHG